MKGNSDIELGYSSREKIRENLESVLDMKLSSDVLVDQITLACLAPILRGGGVGKEELIKSLGGGVELAEARRDFQQILDFYVGRYVIKFLVNVQSSLKIPKFRRITQEGNKLLSNSNSFEIEEDFDFSNIPKNGITAGEIGNDLEHGEEVVRKEGYIPSGSRVGVDPESIIPKADSFAVDGSRFTDEFSGEVPDFDFDDFDLD